MAVTGFVEILKSAGNRLPGPPLLEAGDVPWETWALLPGTFFSAPLSLLLPVNSIAVLCFSSPFALLAHPALPITP